MTGILRGLLYSVALCLLGVTIATAASARPKPIIPKTFHGEWYTEPQTCGYDNMAAFIINDTSAESGETDGLVVAVRILSLDHIIVTTRQIGEATADTPPGTTPKAWRLKSDYQLSEKGSRLKIKFGRRHTLDYIRCAPPPQADLPAS